MCKRVSLIAIALCASFLLRASAAEAAGLRDILPPRHGGVYVVAHRGAHDGIPENTLAAYRKAIELGCDFVEVDVRTSKDGHLVSVHNASVDAYTQGETGLVKALTLAELQALDIGSRVGPEWAEERIPSMEQVFELCKGKIGLYLDVKDADAEQLLALVRRHGMEKHCLWYAAPQQLKQVAESCAECIPMPDPGIEGFLPKVIERHQPKVIAAVWKHFSPSFVRTCHAAGVLVIVDEGDATSWAPALEWGADGIQTDDPAGLIAHLRKQMERGE